MLNQAKTVNNCKKTPLLYEVSVPFNCDEAAIEQTLLKFLVDLISHKSMHTAKKLFFVPVGLPGMGKSTLAKHIRQATEKSKKAQTQLSFHKVSYDRILGDNLNEY